MLPPQHPRHQCKDTWSWSSDWCYSWSSLCSWTIYYEFVHWSWCHGHTSFVVCQSEGLSFFIWLHLICSMPQRISIRDADCWCFCSGSRSRSSSNVSNQESKALLEEDDFQWYDEIQCFKLLLPFQFHHHLHHQHHLCHCRSPEYSGRMYVCR